MSSHAYFSARRATLKAELDHLLAIEPRTVEIDAKVEEVAAELRAVDAELVASERSAPKPAEPTLPAVDAAFAGEIPSAIREARAALTLAEADLSSAEATLAEARAKRDAMGSKAAFAKLSDEIGWCEHELALRAKACKLAQAELTEIEERELKTVRDSLRRDLLSVKDRIDSFVAREIEIRTLSQANFDLIQAEQQRLDDVARRLQAASSLLGDRTPVTLGTPLIHRVATFFNRQARGTPTVDRDSQARKGWIRIAGFGG